jgi:hypothetical protein
MSEQQASAEQPEEPQSDSVFDFLYNDVRRVDSFLSQFSESGVLQKVTETDSVRHGRRTKTAGSAAASIPTIVGGQLNHEREATHEGTLAGERVYDPLWTNALTLLDCVGSGNMLGRSLTESAVGQFVLVAGTLVFLDLAVVKQVWDMPKIRELMLSGMSGSVPNPFTKSGKRGHQNDPNKEFLAFMLNILKLFPHGMQARVFTSNNEVVWCSLRDDSLIGASSDLLLKHGAALSGTWNILGVLDAVPDSFAAGETGLDERQMQAFSSEVGAQAMLMLSPIARAMLGRPAQAFGLTPLLIFRRVHR